MGALFALKLGEMETECVAWVVVAATAAAAVSDALPVLSLSLFTSC